MLAGRWCIHLSTAVLLGARSYGLKIRWTDKGFIHPVTGSRKATRSAFVIGLSVWSFVHSLVKGHRTLQPYTGPWHWTTNDRVSLVKFGAFAKNCVNNVTGSIITLWHHKLTLLTWCTDPSVGINYIRCSISCHFVGGLMKALWWNTNRPSCMLKWYPSYMVNISSIIVLHPNFN